MRVCLHEGQRERERGVLGRNERKKAKKQPPVLLSHAAITVYNMLSLEKKNISAFIHFLRFYFYSSICSTCSRTFTWCRKMIAHHVLPSSSCCCACGGGLLPICQHLRHAAAVQVKVVEEGQLIHFPIIGERGRGKREKAHLRCKFTHPNLSSASYNQVKGIKFSFSPSSCGRRTTSCKR